MTDGAATLRVATFNVRAAIGPGPFPDRWWRRIDRERLAAIGRAVLALDADVVALQELALLNVDGLIVDNATDLATQTGYEMRFGATRHIPIEEAGCEVGAGLFGDALLTRLAIRAARTIGLPQAAEDAFVEPPGAADEHAGVRYADAPESIREPRCLLLCELELSEGARISVGSTHLSYRGSGERRLQAQAIAGQLEEITHPVVLAGDLNAPIESSELQPLRDVLVDGFAAVGVAPGDVRRQTTDEGQLIDHVLVRGAGVRACRVAREVGDLSDHWPVVAELRIGDGS